MFNEKKYFTALDMINKMVGKNDTTEYSNMVIASAIAKGHEDKLTEDWIRKHLLSCVEDEFMTYGQALTLAPIYERTIKAVMANI